MNTTAYILSIVPWPVIIGIIIFYYRGKIQAIIGEPLKIDCPGNIARCECGHGLNIEYRYCPGCGRKIQFYRKNA